jgi:hypothetical protein
MPKTIIVGGELAGLAMTWIGTRDYIKTLDQLSFREWRIQHRIAKGVERKLWNAICLSLGFIGAEENIALYKSLGYQETHREPFNGLFIVHLSKPLAMPADQPDPVVPAADR